MPDNDTSTPDYKTEIAILGDLIVDLYVKHRALETVLVRRCDSIAVGDLRGVLPEIRAKMENLPEIQKLRQVLDRTTLEVAAQVLKDFRD